MEVINCDLGEQSYPIKIGTNLLAKYSLFAEYVSSKKVLIVTDTNVADVQASTVACLLSSINENSNIPKAFQAATRDSAQVISKSSRQQCEGYSKDKSSVAAAVLVLPAGEINKTWLSVTKILDHLIANNYGRDTVLIALGGGVISDIVGFAASCYMRGVAWIALPTTLLAQVDAAVGGKTGINYLDTKNFLGSFWQPQMVIMDLLMLAKLPEREYIAGLAEVVKYGIAFDAKFFAWLEANYTTLLQRDMQALQYIVKKSCEFKAKIVSLDMRDHNCERVLLNFGHTFAHAIESMTKFEHYVHGEAVAIGMVLAAKLSYQINWCRQETVNRIQKLLTNIGLPTMLGNFDCSELWLHMRKDKKHTNGNLRFVLPKDIGRVEVNDKIAEIPTTLWH